MPRRRKRRTIPAGQLALALDGKLEAVFGYSFILTDLDLEDPVDVAEDERGLRLAEVEHWYRDRTDIEALNKDAKHGAALRHVPSNRAINSVWMHAALLGCAIAAWSQELTGIDHGNGRRRFTVTRLHREVIATPQLFSKQMMSLVARCELALDPYTRPINYGFGGVPRNHVMDGWYGYAKVAGIEPVGDVPRLVFELPEETRERPLSISIRTTGVEELSLKANGVDVEARRTPLGIVVKVPQEAASAYCAGRLVLSFPGGGEWRVLGVEITGEGAAR